MFNSRFKKYLLFFIFSFLSLEFKIAAAESTVSQDFTSNNNSSSQNLISLGLNSPPLAA